MSRCFPYPPPGYVRNEALVESIKNEIKKAEKEKKKEKRREKKEKDKNIENGGDVNNKHKHKRKHRDGRSEKDKKKGDREKKRKHDSEQNDKSSLTEELGQPVNFHNSSDSTSNSSKAQIQSSPTDDRHNPASIFRIRLPLQRHKDPQVHKPCSASVRSDDFTSERSENVISWSKNTIDCPCSTSASDGPETNLPTKEEFGPSSTAAEVPDEKVGALFSSFPTRRLSRSELKYKNLLESWVPPPLQGERLDHDDVDWLFQRKLSRGCIVEQGKVENDYSNPWPRSCYLQEADIYALPYTVPY